MSFGRVSWACPTLGGAGYLARRAFAAFPSTRLRDLSDLRIVELFFSQPGGNFGTVTRAGTGVGRRTADSPMGGRMVVSEEGDRVDFHLPLFGVIALSKAHPYILRYKKLIPFADYSLVQKDVIATLVRSNEAEAFFPETNDLSCRRANQRLPECATGRRGPH